MTVTFPDNFLWGTATSAYQIEGAAAEDGKSPSVWDVFCATPGKTHAGDSGAVACDHYHRYREDVALMRRLGLPSYRFSISWPRVLPQGRGDVNQAGMDFYDRLVDELLAAGIIPMATLHHWDVPATYQIETGAWAHPDSPHVFADYADLMFGRLGDRVPYWLTINEPWCIAKDGYMTGAHAPGIKDQALGYRVGHNLLRAHAYSVARYRATARDTGRISFALNTSYDFPASDSPEDVAAAERATVNFGGWFGDPAHFGDYPALLRERLGALLPEFTPEDSRLLKGSMDFIALNYYSSNVVRHAPHVQPLQYEHVPQPQRAHTLMGWPIVPEGLHGLLHWLSRRYVGVPIYVTENGAALEDQPDDTGYVNDQGRIAFLRDHIAAMAQAMAEGVDVRGYLVWSLMDNLEWSEGFRKRFGLVRCDFQTQQRTIKASGHWFAKLIASRQLDTAAGSPHAEGGGAP